MRQARLAVALLALNPVFLFTSGSAVVEPLLTAILTGAALAAVRGRMKFAALLAALACLTATKAWIWIAAVAGFTAVELLRRRAPAGRRWPALAWAVPAIAVLVFLQLGFAPATHSVARGSLELASATTRGSIPGGALARVAQLAVTYGRAALPLFVFGALGLWMVVRRWSLGLDRATRAFPPLPGARLSRCGVRSWSRSEPTRVAIAISTPHCPRSPCSPRPLSTGMLPAVRLVAVAATGLIAVAFLPAFTSFAADNAGLIAAGRAVGERLRLADHRFSRRGVLQRPNSLAYRWVASASPEPPGRDRLDGLTWSDRRGARGHQLLPSHRGVSRSRKRPCGGALRTTWRAGALPGRRRQARLRVPASGRRS